MLRGLSSQSFLRGIFEETRKTRMLLSSRRPPPSPASEIRPMSTFHLPDVRAIAQYLVDMGIRPSLARRLSNTYMDIVARYRQVFESYFRRAIQGNYDLHPEHYRDIFAVQFRTTIQALASRIMSTAWAVLREAGTPALFSSRGIDVRVDAATKAQILSRLGLDTAFFIILEAADTIELPGEERETEGNPTITSPASALLFEPDIPSIREFFSSEKPSSCFPERYPPLSNPISSSQKTPFPRFFTFTPTSAKSERPNAECNVDTSFLTTLFGQMAVTTSEVTLKAQENHKCFWDLRSKKLEPLPPILSPVVSVVSGPPQKHRASSTGGVLSEKSNTVPRRRRIAALPTRQTKANAWPNSDLSSHSAANPPVLAPASDNIMSHAPFSLVAKTMATEELSVDYVISSPGTAQHGPRPQPRHISRATDIVGPKADSSGRKKGLPFPRKVVSQMQPAESQRQASAQPTPSRRKTPLSTALRAPSLVSDMSFSDSFSSSDEFDTPPSTPPEHSYDPTAHNPLATSFDISSKSNTSGPFRRPVITNAESPDMGKRGGIHIDFTNGEAQKENDSFASLLVLK